MAKEEIITRKDEVRFKTSDPDEMLNMWIPNAVHRVYIEDFFDEHTAEVIPIERKELILDRGTFVDKNVVAKIRFWMNEGSIKEIEVSNQKRLAYEYRDNSFSPWIATISMNGKNIKFLLYASSVQNALDILNDFIELNYVRGYSITSLKTINYCTVLEDNLKPVDKYQQEQEAGLERKFYQLEMKITYSDDTDATHDFIVDTFDTNRALMCISQYVKQREKELREDSIKNGWSEHKERDFELCIEKAVQIPISQFIPKEFSLVYNKH